MVHQMIPHGDPCQTIATVESPKISQIAISERKEDPNKRWTLRVVQDDWQGCTQYFLPEEVDDEVYIVHEENCVMDDDLMT